MTRLVLDASAGVELLLNTPSAHALSAKLPSQAEWWVPEHYFLEVAGALRRGLHRETITSAQGERAFMMLSRGVFRRAEIRPLLTDAWSRRSTLTIADALYVVLAEHLNATLVTADERLARAPGMTVATITP